MNKLLPILLVVVLSGCSHYSNDYYGGVEPPYTPETHHGSLFPILTNEGGVSKKNTPKKVNPRSRFTWNTFETCMNQENSKKPSIKDYFQDTSFENIVNCEKNNKVCGYNCNYHESKLVNFSDLLLKEVQDGNISSAQAKIELVQYIDMTVSQYKHAIEQKNYEDYIKVLEQQIARERRARIHSEVFDKMNTDFQINALKNKVRSLEDKNFWNNQ